MKLPTDIQESIILQKKLGIALPMMMDLSSLLISFPVGKHMAPNRILRSISPDALMDYSENLAGSLLVGPVNPENVEAVIREVWDFRKDHPDVCILLQVMYPNFAAFTEVLNFVRNAPVQGIQLSCMPGGDLWKELRESTWENMEESMLFTAVKTAREVLGEEAAVLLTLGMTESGIRSGEEDGWALEAIRQLRKAYKITGVIFSFPEREDCHPYMLAFEHMRRLLSLQFSASEIPLSADSFRLVGDMGPALAAGMAAGKGCSFCFLQN